MFDRQNTLAKTDPELWAAIQNENKRQEDHIELIASENYTSPAVMQACLLYTSPSPRDRTRSRMPSSA